MRVTRNFYSPAACPGLARSRFPSSHVVPLCLTLRVVARSYAARWGSSRLGGQASRAVRPGSAPGLWDHYAVDLPPSRYRLRGRAARPAGDLTLVLPPAAPGLNPGRPRGAARRFWWTRSRWRRLGGLASGPGRRVLTLGAVPAFAVMFRVPRGRRHAPRHGRLLGGGGGAGGAFTLILAWVSPLPVLSGFPRLLPVALLSGLAGFARRAACPRTRRRGSPPRRTARRCPAGRGRGRRCTVRWCSFRATTRRMSRSTSGARSTSWGALDYGP